MSRPSVRMSVRPYVRPYARIRAGDEFVFVLDLESFSANSNPKTFFGLSRVNLFVVEICYFRLFFLAFSYDLDITLQLKRSDWMKRYEVRSWTKCSTRRFVIAFHHFGTPILLFESSFSGFD